MGKAIAYAIRLKIVSRLQEGEKPEYLAEDFNCSVQVVKKIWKQYQENGEAALHTKYGNCGRRSSYDEEVRLKADQIRDGTQGGVYVHCKMLEQYPGEPVPSARTLQRWWKKQGTNREKGRPLTEEKK